MPADLLSGKCFWSVQPICGTRDSRWDPFKKGKMASKGVLTRQNIVRESLQLFSVKGYFNTSINDILQATGLTKGGLYGHFRSKEAIWYAVYEEAVSIWRSRVFCRIRQISDPLVRIERVIENDMRDYLGADVFEGGCFFLNMLVELSGQSQAMSRHILRGYVQFSRLIRNWLREASEKGILKPDLNHKDIASFIIISLNGASAIYSASRDAQIWQQATIQLHFYLEQLRQQRNRARVKKVTFEPSATQVSAC